MIRATARSLTVRAAGSAAAAGAVCAAPRFWRRAIWTSEETLSALKHSGYDGHIVIEFEGMEDARYATSVGLHNARRIWDQV